MKDRALEMNRVIIALEDAWIAHPEWRLGQLIVNVTSRDPFFITDHEIWQRLEAITPIPEGSE